MDKVTTSEKIITINEITDALFDPSFNKYLLKSPDPTVRLKYLEVASNHLNQVSVLVELKWIRQVLEQLVDVQVKHGK